jgi:TM2 domain-containing membrane protein YozV
MKKILMKSKMKNDQQTLIFAALFLVAMWLLFFRKSEKFCTGCGAPMAA